MRKHFFSCLMLFVLLAASAMTAQAQGNGNGNGTGNGANNRLIGRAIGAFNSGCGGPSIGPLDGAVETVGICFAGGFLTRVLLYRQVNCQQIDCNAIRFAPVGYVTFDCEGNVLGVSCTWP